MQLVWSRDAWQDYLHWQAHDATTLAKINSLIRDCSRNPFVGIGKPEPLTGDRKGWWSRRITGEHRLVYRVTGTPPEQKLDIAACRWHYQ